MTVTTATFTPAQLAKVATPQAPSDTVEVRPSRVANLEQWRGRVWNRVKDDSVFLQPMPTSIREVLEAVVDESSDLDRIGNVLRVVEAQYKLYLTSNPTKPQTASSSRTSQQGRKTTLESYEPGSDALRLETLRLQLMSRRASYESLVTKRSKMVQRDDVPADKMKIWLQVLDDVKSLERPVPPKASVARLERIQHVLGMLQKEINSGRTATVSTGVRQVRRPRRGFSGIDANLQSTISQMSEEAAAQSRDTLNAKKYPKGLAPKVIKVESTSKSGRGRKAE